MAKQEKTAAELYREERKARIAKAAKRNSKKSHGVSVSNTATKAITAVIAVIVVVAIAFSVVSSTGVLERSKVAIKIGDSEVKLGEYSYYYSAGYSAVLNQAYSVESQYSGYGAMFTGYDIYTMPDEQSYTGEIEGIENPTWADYFSQYAQDQIRYKKIALDYASENNIVLDDEDIADVEETLSQWEEQAEQMSENQGATYSLTKYLQLNYGQGVTASIFKELLMEDKLVSKVEETKTQEFKDSYTDEKVLEVYNDEISEFGVVTLRSYVINAEQVASESEDGEETSAVTDETMAKAKVAAEEFAAKAVDEESFKQAASDAEQANGNEEYETYLTDDSLTLVEDTTAATLMAGDEVTEWLTSADTKAGDTYIAEESGTGYTVYYMVEPVHKAADTVATYDVRHILVMFPEEDETNTETDAEQEQETEVKTINAEDYEDVVIDIDVETNEITDIASYNKAIDILTEYLEGDKSEDSFGALAKKYTEDSNGEAGGLYEDVTLGQMVSEFEDWSVDESRKYGDVGIVETTYGYHIMYYVDREITTWDSEIKDHLASEELATFREELDAKEGYDVTVVDEEVVAEARKATMDIAESNVEYFSSYSYY